MTLNRPEHNLLNEAMLREIADGITTAGEREDVKLSSSILPPGFSAAASTLASTLRSVSFQMLDRFSPGVFGHAGSWQARRLRRERPAIGGGAELPLSAILSSPLPKLALLSRRSASAFSPRSLPRFCRFLSDPKLLSSLFSRASR